MNFLRKMAGALGGILVGLIFCLARLVVAATHPAIRRDMAGRGYRILLTGRMDSKNWCQSHLLPLERTPEIAEILMVVDGQLATGAKTRQFRVPAAMGWIKPRAIARSIWAAVIALREKPDVIMAYSFFPPGIFALMAARLSGAASIVQLAGGVLEIESGGTSAITFPIPLAVKRQLVSLCHTLCGHFDSVVVRGRKAEAYLCEHAECKRIDIIPGSVDPERFQQGGFKRTIDVVFIGRIVAVKQPDHIVQILGRVAQRKPDLRAVIAGSGPLLETMKAQAAAQGLAKNIRFAGHVEKVEGLLLRSRIFLLTSRSEGLSIALAEAMMAGAVPVVANVGDLGELVSNGTTGWLIEPGDFDAYARKIVHLLENEADWNILSQAAKTKAFDNNAVETVVRRWQCYLREIVDREINAVGRTPLTI